MQHNGIIPEVFTMHFTLLGSIVGNSKLVTTPEKCIIRNNNGFQFKSVNFISKNATQKIKNNNSLLPETRIKAMHKILRK